MLTACHERQINGPPLGQSGITSHQGNIFLCESGWSWSSAWLEFAPGKNATLTADEQGAIPPRHYGGGVDLDYTEWHFSMGALYEPPPRMIQGSSDDSTAG